MKIVFLLALAVAVVSAGWLLAHWLGRRYGRYREHFQQEAGTHLEAAFVFVDTGRLWLANVALWALLAGAVYAASGQWPLSVAAAAPAAFLPRLWLRGLHARRQRRFDAQLPDFLLALAGALRAGAGVQAALGPLAASTPAPLGQEFGLLLRELRLGKPLEAGLAALVERVPTEGARLAASALTLASRHGGSLAEVLERAAATLEARHRLQARASALTAQGRLQAVIMAALPLVLGVALHALDPEAMRQLWQTPAGWTVLGLVVLLEAVGIYWIGRIVRIPI